MIKNIFLFPIISQKWYDADRQNMFLWKMKVHSSCVINSIFADGLAMEGPMASSATVMIWFSQNIPFSPVNSLVPVRCRCNFKLVLFKFTSRIIILSISCEIALGWMPQDFTDDKSTLVQVMAWCHQATSHYLGQCLPTSISPYGVARPQWVNTLRSGSQRTGSSVEVMASRHTLCKISERN